MRRPEDNAQLRDLGVTEQRIPSSMDWPEYRRRRDAVGEPVGW
jgi:hypothetical protein